MKIIFFWALVLTGTMLAGCATTERRPDRSLVDLFAARNADVTVRSTQSREFMEKLLKRAESKKQSTIDLLVISSGGGAPSAPACSRGGGASGGAGAPAIRRRHWRQHRGDDRAVRVSR